MNFPGTDSADALASGDEPASWAAVAAIGIAAFALVTTEFLPVGLLPSISVSFGQSVGRVGLMVTLPGVVAAIAAPMSVAVAGKMDRRRVLVGLLALLILSNLFVAFAPTFELALLGRLLLGVAVGGFWTIGGSLGPRLQPRRAAKASSLILAGVSLGTVAGVPAGALLGSLVGWRWAFGGAALVGLAVLVLLLALLPSLPAERGRGLRDIPRLVRLPEVRMGMLAILLIFGGQFGSYTYISPFLLSVTGLGPLAISAVLLAYGGAAFLGNFLGGWMATRSVRGALIATGLVMGLPVALLAWMGHDAGPAVALLMVWGIGFGMLPIAMQSWLFKAALKYLETVQSIFVCLSQVAIAVGSLMGGLLTDRLGVMSAMMFGAIASLVTASLMLVGAKAATSSKASSPCQGFESESLQSNET